MQRMSPAESETVEVAEGVHFTPLVVGEHTSVQHVHVEPGSAVPEHSHDHEPVGYITQGTFDVLRDSERHVVSAGESSVIPAARSTLQKTR